MEQKNFAEGLYFNESREGSPEWILGSISIEPKKFTDWMRANYDKNEKYIKIDIKMGKSGKPYTELNTWKPNQAPQNASDNNKVPSRSSEGNYGQSQGTDKPMEFKDDNFENEIPF